MEVQMGSGVREEPRLRCADCKARDLGLCALVGPDLRHRLGAIAVERSNAPGQRIWQEADHKPFGVLIDGHVRVQVFRLDGHRRILELNVPGDILDARMRCEPGSDFEAASDIRVCWFDRSRFEQLVEEFPQIRHAVCEMNEMRIERLRLWTWAKGSLNLCERICAFIALATRHMPFAPLPWGGGILTMQVSRADIADHVGTSVESISRMTHRLAEKELIRIRSPRHFEIPDLARLVRAACLGSAFGNVPFPAKLPRMAASAPHRDPVGRRASAVVPRPKRSGPRSLRATTARAE
jgi:CRP/FNR family transcriptional regulator, anaerobic regulatory protein